HGPPRRRRIPPCRQVDLKERFHAFLPRVLADLEIRGGQAVDEFPNAIGDAHGHFDVVGLRSEDGLLLVGKERSGQSDGRDERENNRSLHEASTKTIRAGAGLWRIAPRRNAEREASSFSCGASGRTREKKDRRPT